MGFVNGRTIDLDFKCDLTNLCLLTLRVFESSGDFSAQLWNLFLSLFSVSAALNDLREQRSRRTEMRLGSLLP